MIEIVRHRGGECSFGYAGDTLNTAVYMAPLGLKPSYITALGEDPFSEGMLALCRDEGIGVDLVVRRRDKLPGLYIVSTDERGERQFHYWRNNSAARTLFTMASDDAQLNALRGFPMVYWSGITLAILRPEARLRLFAVLSEVRARKGRVAFDCNFRSRLWPDLEVACSSYLAALAHADLTFTSLDDEMLVFGNGREEALLERHVCSGVGEIVIKNSRPGCRVVIPAEGLDVSADAPPVAKVVDTTAAGDSFAAAHLAARTAGGSALAAVLKGHRLAGAVVGVHGAILPMYVMPPSD